MTAQIQAASNLTITPLDAPLGAKVEGVRLDGGCDALTFAGIQNALDSYSVISLPGQNLSATQLASFSRRFGELEPHVMDQYHHPDDPAVLILSTEQDNGKPRGFVNPPDPSFHSDLSYVKQPTSYTLLYAVNVPEGLGDTLFVSMVEAYQRLPADLKERLQGLRGEHNYSYRNTRLSQRQREQTPTVEHPVIRTHPATGKPALFINPTFTMGLVGLSEEDSGALKQQVFDHSLQEQYQLHYRWRNGDLVIWDNAAVVHTATPLPPGTPRTLLRTTVKGTVPV